MIDRMIRAARLDVHLYEEVEANGDLTKEAFFVVALGSLAAGIGLGLASSPGLIIIGILVALVSWAVYAGLAYYVGTRWFAEATTHADWGQLLRAVGYANAPRALLVLLFIPVLGPIVGLVVFVWVLIATVIAVRQALDFTGTGRAIGTAAVAWLSQVVILAALSALTL